MWEKSLMITGAVGIVFSFSACSLNLSVPKDVPPQIILSDKTLSEKVSEEPTQPVLEPGRNVMTEVLLPDAERKTEALLKQYQDNLEALEKNLPKN
ncbi:MAG TPA: hypothetical protein PL066_03885 [bacterium]|nr:hypothetical protein [bacterium]